MNILRSSLAAVLATTLTAGVSHAQTTYATDPAGFTTVTVRARTNPAVRAVTLIVLPMERPSTFAAGLSNASFTTNGSGQSVITFATNYFTNGQFGSIANSNNPHYFRVANGANEGDFSSVVTNNTNSITIADNLTAILSNQVTFEVIPYWTLDTALPAGGGLNGGANATAADTVALYNTNFIATTYFYNSTTNQWRTGITPSGNAIIPPGTGMLIDRKTNAPASIVVVGNVPIGNSAVDVNGSTGPTRNTLVGSAYPLSSTNLAGIGLYTTNTNTGLAPGPNATAADTVQIFNPTNGVPTTYFVFTNATNSGQWRTGITPSDNVVIPEGAAILIARKTNRPAFTWYIPQPPMNLAP